MRDISQRRDVAQEQRHGPDRKIERRSILVLAGNFLGLTDFLESAIW